MTQKRFECNKGSRIIIDNETTLHYIMTLDWECSLVTKLLNRFAEENEQLKEQLEDCEFAHRTEMAHHRVVEKELKEKIAKRDYTSMELYND